MAKTAKSYKFVAVPRGYVGWVQAGKAGPEAKCAAHYVAKAGASLTACGRMAVRGKEPTQGFAHYRLSWFQVDPSNARSVCRGCQLAVPVAQPEEAVA